MKRLFFLDCSKGAVILLMLFTHTSLNPVINTWAFSFQMQFFFMVCGVIFASRDLSPNQIDLGRHLKKRLFQLGIPYLVFCLALTVFYSCLDLLAGQETHIPEYLLRIVMLQGIDSLWFLPVFFLAELIFLAFMKIRNGRWGAVVAAGLIIVALCFLSDSMPSAQPLRLVVKCLIGFVFVCFGYELRQRKWIEKISIPMASFFLIVGAVLSHLNGFTAVGSLELGNAPLFFLNAALTGTAILALFFHAEKAGASLRFLSWFGRNTIVILCTNNLLIETVRLLDHRLTGDFLLHTGLVGSLLFTILLILLEIPLIKLAEGRFAPLFGKRIKKV